MTVILSCSLSLPREKAICGKLTDVGRVAWLFVMCRMVNGELFLWNMIPGEEYEFRDGVWFLDIMLLTFDLSQYR